MGTRTKTQRLPRRLHHETKPPLVRQRNKNRWQKRRNQEQIKLHPAKVPVAPSSSARVQIRLKNIHPCDLNRPSNSIHVSRWPC